MKNPFEKYYKKSKNEKLTILEEQNYLTRKEIKQITQQVGLTEEVASHMIENQITLYNLPFGIAPNFLINDKEYVIPMVTEEPSVIAAASNAAKLIKQAGGFTTFQPKRYMVGEVALQNCPNPKQAIQAIKKEANKLVELANLAYPSIVKRGGGAIELSVKELKNQEDNFIVVYLTVDTCEAMGANMLNTMLEALVVPLEELTGGQRLMAILSNFAVQSLASAKCQIPCELLAKGAITGEEVRDNIIQATNFAKMDIYRATTHNKGIMNGIDAIVIATGNDWRAIEAGCHAYASHTGQYQPMTNWTKAKNGDLVGTITLPLAVGTVGGSIGIHPGAQLAHSLLDKPSASQLAQIIACVGLGQNLAAVKALVTDGIQKGHMQLQAKSLAIAVGATGEEISQLTSALLKEKGFNQALATQILKDLRK
ncbi:3-hydroxy-3-methylglutaryl-coenzyme A reductase [Granulicatella balaenopterae]|uniref:3-hydroxy-3-methylglutaryl coenzyme A reductase n=2 Tax=Granulicatella balaenopterae TaxID=137733 RepID=A0A1H9GSS3_9LACT|nr:3-hydroxy-3-methylglutaryl-coenzyme A reductase [Granulicatella balaenopterae]